MSKREVAKKATERRYLDILVRGLSDFPAGEIVAGERPDFSVIGSKKVGIEIATYNGRARPEEEHFARTVALARDHFVKAGGPTCAVSFFFRVYPRQHGLTPMTLADRISRLVSAHIPPDASGSVELDWNQLVPADLDGILDSVRIGRVDGLEKCAWTAHAGFMEYPLPILRALIAAKEPVARRAQEIHDEAWLLVVAEGQSYSRMIDPGQLTTESYATSFDRLLLVDLWRPNIFKLATARQSAGPIAIEPR